MKHFIIGPHFISFVIPQRLLTGHFSKQSEATGIHIKSFNNLFMYSPLTVNPIMSYKKYGNVRQCQTYE